MSRIPMPSPRGTNKAGLFLSGGSRAAAAYDAAPDDDQTITLKRNEVEALLNFLDQRLDDGDMDEVRQMLSFSDDDAVTNAGDRKRRRGANDEMRRATTPPVNYDAATFPNRNRLKG